MTLKIYTKKGDAGYSSLMDGKKTPKYNIVFKACGSLDELNSFVGLCLSGLKNERQELFLTQIQVILFNLGACVALQGKTTPIPAITELDVINIEQEIDFLNDSLPELKNFILPQGNMLISYVHICRSICRRAERDCVELFLNHPEYSLMIKYLNRLSDYFFVLARYIGIKQNVKEIVWKGLF